MKIKSTALAFIFLAALPVFIPIAVFLVFNLLTPVWWDDFVMACFFTTWGDAHTTLLSSFTDVVTSTYNMYQTHHGRSVADFFNFLFMLFKDKTLFNVCNTAVYSLFIFLMGFHITGAFKKVSPLLFMFINILLWFALAAWGQDLLWLTGSCNYLWTGTLILLFLVPFRKKADNPSYTPCRAVSLLWLVPGVLAGWGMENSASGVFCLLLAYFILKKHKKEPAAVFEVSGALGFLCGFFMLIHARHNLFPGFWGLIKNAVKVCFYFVFNDALLAGSIILFGIELLYFKRESVSKTASAFLIAAFGSVASMILPGFFGGRSEFMTQVFLIITLLSLVLQLRRHVPQRFIIMAGVAVMLAFLPSFYRGSTSILRSFLYAQAREQYIMTEKQRGNLSIKVKAPIPVTDSHSGMYEGIDVQDDPASVDYVVHNSAKVTWYGIQSLDGIPAKGKEVGLRAAVKAFLMHRNIADMLTTIYENW